MSLYNELFGINENSFVILAMLDLDMEYFERFRDIDIIKDATVIRVFVRLGGGNREPYKETWKKIRRNPLYITDYDDTYDNTYAYIEYQIPDFYRKTAKILYKGEPISFGERFQKYMKEMNVPNSEAAKKAEEIAKKIVSGIDNGQKFIGI